MEAYLPYLETIVNVNVRISGKGMIAQVRNYYLVETFCLLDYVTRTETYGLQFPVSGLSWKLAIFMKSLFLVKTGNFQMKIGSFHAILIFSLVPDRSCS